jgi:hypothetical protein
MSLVRCSSLRIAMLDGTAREADVSELLGLLPDVFAAAAAWQKGVDVLAELQDRAIPCGHTVGDLIGGDGAVTKCGACLAARQKVAT